MLKLDTSRDGMDIDCCHNVRISNCSVNSPWDDGICLKSSYALGCLRATENVTINNCYVTGGYIEGTLLDGTFQRAPAGYAGRTGRIKFGTESNGGFKNIAIANCVFDDCGGLAIESVDGGDIEDVTINNISMRNIVNSPIFIRLGNRARGPNHPPVGVIRRINISDWSSPAPARNSARSSAASPAIPSRTCGSATFTFSRKAAARSGKPHSSPRKTKRLIRNPACSAPCHPTAFSSAMRPASRCTTSKSLAPLLMRVRPLCWTTYQTSGWITSMSSLLPAASFLISGT